MKKQLPNILLLVIVLVNILFIGLYVRNNGVGLFFSTTGIVFLVLGIFIFIFFLSIDPGYGWIKPIDLTRNYIMIFTSMAVCFAGIVLIVTGQHINELHVKTLQEKRRCQELVDGNAAEVMKKDWYSLRDYKEQDSCRVYLFQKKSDRNIYKILATVNHDGASYTTGNLRISSQVIPQTLTVSIAESACPAVFEKIIRIDFKRHQELREQVQFDVTISVSSDPVPVAIRSENKKTIQVRLENKPGEPERISGQNTG